MSQEIEFQKGYNEVEETDIKLGDLDNDYVKQRAEEFMEEGYSEEEAIEKAREADENNIEEEVILEYISDEIYDSPNATIREYIANAETATLRAVENHGLEHPKINITYNKNEGKLTIQDNGIGISVSKMREVCGVVGRTDMLNSGDMSGMFGMGMYSVFQLIGINSRAEIITHSRETDENYGILFGLRDKTYQNQSLDSNVYGTKVSMVLDEKKENELNVRDTVETYAKWCRVPVSYTEIDENKEEVFNEEYGGSELEDTLEDGKMSIVIENDLYKVVSQDDINPITLLVSMEISRNDYECKYDSPFKFSVRIKEEGGQIVNGWAKGKIPIKEKNYEDMDPKYRDRYVKEKWVDPNEAFFGYNYVCLPKPTGDRDRLKKKESKQFMRWVSGKIKERYKDKIEELFDDIKTLEDLKNLDPSEVSTLKRARNETPSNQNLIEYYDLELEEDALEYLDMVNSEVGLGRRRKSAGRVTKKGYRSNKKIEEVIGIAGSEGDVYMGKHLNEKKVKVVWDINEKNQVVSINDEDSLEYEELEEMFGWKKLKDIDLTSLDEYDVSDELINDLQDSDDSNTGISVSRLEKTVPKKKVNLSREGMRAGRAKLEAQDVLKMLDGELEGANSNWNSVERFIPFPTSCDEKVSENYDIAGNIPFQEGEVAIARTTNEVYEYLKDHPKVVSKEEYINEINHVMVRTINNNIVDLSRRVENTERSVNILTCDSKQMSVVNSDDTDKVKKRLKDKRPNVNDDFIVMSDNYNELERLAEIEDTFIDESDYTREEISTEGLVVEDIWYPDWDVDYRSLRTHTLGTIDVDRPGDEYRILKLLHDEGYSYEEALNEELPTP